MTQIEISLCQDARLAGKDDTMDTIELLYETALMSSGFVVSIRFVVLVRSVFGNFLPECKLLGLNLTKCRKNSHEVSLTDFSHDWVYAAA